MTTGCDPQLRLLIPQVQLLLGKAGHAHLVTKVLVSAVWHFLALHLLLPAFMFWFILHYSVVFHAGGMLPCIN